MPKTVTLSEWEINVILHALSERPYKEVACIIQNIVEQTNVKAPE